MDQGPDSDLNTGSNAQVPCGDKGNWK